MWEYYEVKNDDEEVIETTYYHQGEEVITLSGKNTSWKNNIPAPSGEHYDDLLDEVLSTETPDRTMMLWDVIMGFKQLSEPY